MNKPLLIFLGLLVATFCNAQPSSGSGPTGGGGGGGISASDNTTFIGNNTFTGEMILNGDIQIRPAAITSTNLNWAAEVESITLSGNTALNVGTPDASGDVTVLWVTGGGSDYVLTLSSNIVDISNDRTITAGDSITVSANQNLVLGFSYDAATTIRVTGLPDVTPYNGTFTESLGADHTLSASQLTGEGYGSVHYITATSDITLPDAFEGGDYTLIADGTITVSLVPDPTATTDTLRLDGVDLTAGNEADSDGVAGSIFKVTYHSANKWYVASNGGVDGGAAD